MSDPKIIEGSVDEVFVRMAQQLTESGVPLHEVALALGQATESAEEAAEEHRRVVNQNLEPMRDKLPTCGCLKPNEQGELGFAGVGILSAISRQAVNGFDGLASAGVCPKAMPFAAAYLATAIVAYSVLKRQDGPESLAEAIEMVSQEANHTRHLMPDMAEQFLIRAWEQLHGAQTTEGVH